MGKKKKIMSYKVVYLYSDYLPSHTFNDFEFKAT
jgi:hypothetical protein